MVFNIFLTIQDAYQHETIKWKTEIILVKYPNSFQKTPHQGFFSQFFHWQIYKIIILLSILILLLAYDI